MFKVAIVYKIKKKIWGGGNSFLKNLKKNLKKNQLFTNKLSEADIILFNGHQDIFSVLYHKIRYPNKVFIHRFDGPMQDARLTNNNLDKFLYYYNNIVADGTIFQSEFSRKKNINYGFEPNNIDMVIHNFVSSDIFNLTNKKQISKKIRITSSSFSNNKNKGLDDLEILDNKLNFKKIELLHIGNINNKFKNIKVITQKNHNEYAKILKSSQYFLTLSYFECCSNSVLEALCTGNKIIYRKNSGISEIAENHSIEFENIIHLVDQINSLEDEKIINTKIDAKFKNEEGTIKYINFFTKVMKEKKKFHYGKIFFFIKLIVLYYKYKIINFFKKIKS